MAQTPRNPDIVNKAPPRILSDPLAKKAWRALQKQIEEAGKWKPEYTIALTQLVDALMSYHRQAEQFAAGCEDEILRNPKTGCVYRNPRCDLMVAASNKIKKYLDCFGMHPHAHAKLMQYGGIGQLNLFDELGLNELPVE